MESDEMDVVLGLGRIKVRSIVLVPIIVVASLNNVTNITRRQPLPPATIFRPATTTLNVILIIAC